MNHDPKLGEKWVRDPASLDIQQLIADELRSISRYAGSDEERDAWVAAADHVGTMKIVARAEEQTRPTFGNKIRETIETLRGATPEPPTPAPCTPLKRIKDTSYCTWCDGDKIPPFTEESEHEIYIRRYVGGQGHLVDLAYHKECLKQMLKMHDFCEVPVTSSGAQPPDLTVRGSDEERAAHQVQVLEDWRGATQGSSSAKNEGRGESAESEQNKVGNVPETVRISKTPPLSNERPSELDAANMTGISGPRPTEDSSVQPEEIWRELEAAIAGENEARRLWEVAENRAERAEAEVERLKKGAQGSSVSAAEFYKQSSWSLVGIIGPDDTFRFAEAYAEFVARRGSQAGTGEKLE